MAWAILDTGVYIGHWQQGLYVEVLEQVRRRFVVRHSAVVLSELRRGARLREAKRLVHQLRARAVASWAPSAEDWWEAGHVVREIGDEQHWDPAKRREFQNDALIALTARRHGAVVVTANQGDFDLLSRRLRVPIWRVRTAQLTRPPGRR
jgi:predicted nucleic acid-binding protein